MKPMITDDEIEAFVNALQLSIKAKINGWTRLEDHITLVGDIKGNEVDIAEEAVMRILELPITASGTTKIKWIINAEKITSKLTQFLMLSRLNPENMKKLAQMDSEYAGFTKKALGFLTASEVEVQQLMDVVHFIFQKVEEKKMTLHQLSVQSGLTPMTLSNLKRGSDIRLSSLMKLCKALGIKLKMA